VTSDGDSGGGGEPEDAGGGVEALLNDGVPSLERECGCLVPVLSSIVLKQRKRKVKP
jgi:hypothetical protein